MGQVHALRVHLQTMDNRTQKIHDRSNPSNAGTEHSEAVEFATLEWIDWFNNRRLLEPIGNIPPVEAEEAYYAQL
nr:hypothetical protein [Aureimonas psammosilenae]